MQWRANIVHSLTPKSRGGIIQRKWWGVILLSGGVHTQIPLCLRYACQGCGYTPLVRCNTLMTNLLLQYFNESYLLWRKDNSVIISDARKQSPNKLLCHNM